MVLPFRHLKADDNHLYSYAILTWDIPERIREMRLKRYIDDHDNEKGHWYMGLHWDLGWNI